MNVSEVQDQESEVLLPAMNHPSAPACMRLAPMASGQVGKLNYLPPGPPGPLCSPFIAEALPSPGFLTSPTSLFQFLAGRSVCMKLQQLHCLSLLSLCLCLHVCVVCLTNMGCLCQLYV